MEEHPGTCSLYTNITSLYVLKSQVFTFSYTAKSFVFSGKSGDFLLGKATEKTFFPVFDPYISS